MNGARLMAVALVGLLVVPSVALGRNAGHGRTASPMRVGTLDQSQLIDVNRIGMIVTNFGSFAFDAGAGSSGLEFPKGSGKTAVFAGGLWLGGKINGVTKVAVTGYSNEWFPGPILSSGLPADPAAPEHKVYKLNRVYTDTAERDAALADYNAGAVPDGADPVTVQPDGSLNIPGDQMTWCVYNEADSTKKADSGEDAGHTGPLGVECQQTIFAFSRQGALGQTVRVNNDPYTVKGLFIEMGASAGGDDWDDRIVMPYTTTTRRLFNRPSLEQIGQALHVVNERRRQRALKETVDKNETVAGLGKQERPDVVQRGNPRRSLREFERTFRDRRDAAEYSVAARAIGPLVA